MISMPAIPEKMPKMGNRLTRWCGRSLLRLTGWKLEGDIPNESKLIMAAAPHTSNWDFVTAASVILAIGVKLSFLMKKEAFFWPFKSLFQAIGGIPTDRQAPGGMVEQVVSWYRDHEQVWVAITPEGTRGKVNTWKSGFLRIAHAADIPILLVAWDYPSKTIRLCELVTASGDHEADVEKFKSYIDSRFTGRYPKLQ